MMKTIESVFFSFFVLFQTTFAFLGRSVNRNAFKLVAPSVNLAKYDIETFLLTNSFDSFQYPLQIDSVSQAFLEISSSVVSEPTKYWFMLPVSVCVAFCALTAGIGGAALFAPTFLIIFPALGSQYPLESASAAIGTAIMIETFGFSSGCLGYIRRNLIDVQVAARLAIVTVPLAIFSSEYLNVSDGVLKSTYTLLMFTTSFYLLRSRNKSTDTIEESTFVSSEHERTDMTIITDSRGIEYSYPQPEFDFKNDLLSSFGGILCGLLGVGVGEVILPQLLAKGVNVAVAAATSTVVVAVTCASCAGVQISELIKAGGISAVPWNLVIYMIPGVIFGAQLATIVQGRFSQNQIERAVGSLFAVIGTGFLVLTLRSLS